MARARTPLVLAVVAFVLVLGFLSIGRMGPWLKRDGLPTSSVPGPDPIGTIDQIRLRPGEAACEKDVGFDTDSQVAQFVGTPVRGAGPELEVLARAPGYRAVSRVPGGYRDRTVFLQRFQAPPGSVVGEFCVRNRGRRAVALQGSTEFRTDTRQTTTVGGKQVPNMTLRLFEGQPKSFITELPRILDRAALYKVGFLRSWMLWVLLVVVLAGVPLAVLYALADSLRAPER